MRASEAGSRNTLKKEYTTHILYLSSVLKKIMIICNV